MAVVKLVNGDITLTAIDVRAIDTSTLKAKFFLHNVSLGAYSVSIVNPSGEFTTSDQKIAVEESSELLAELVIAGNTRPRVGRVMVLNATLTSKSNINIPYITITTLFSGEVKLLVQRPSETLPHESELSNDGSENHSPTNAVLDGITQDTFLIRNLEPDQKLQFSVLVRDFDRGDHFIDIFYSAKTEEEYLGDLEIGLEEARLSLSQNHIPLPDDFQNALSSRQAWWDINRHQLAMLGFIDRRDERSVELKGGSRNEDVNISNGVLEQTLQANNSDRELCLEKCRSEYLEKLLAIQKWQAACIFTAGLAPTKPAKFAGIAACLAIAQAMREMARLSYECCRIGCVKDPGRPCEGIEKVCVIRGGGGSGGGVCPEFASDPNDKIGPKGNGPEAFIPVAETLFYKVDFENVPTAGAAAQLIKIADQLDSDLDWRTFRLKEIGFNDYRIPVPENRSFFQTRIQLGEDLNNLLADISAGIDIATGQVTWTLTAIDPKTGEQPSSATLGLLPPNDETGRGQGYVTYTVQPKAGLPTGTVISNNATIAFDTEAPITTNTVTNTLDADAPTSKVDALPASSQQTFTLSWSGSDPEDGSGLQRFDIYVSENGGPYQPFLSGTTDTSAQFTGQNGRTYRFYSVARDNAGNVEAAPASPDAATTVGQGSDNPVPTLSGVSPDTGTAGGPQFTLALTGTNFIAGSVVQWNGSPRPTNFISETQLTAIIPATDIVSAGTAAITVVNPAPGGGVSGAVTFTIRALPTITPAAALSRQQGSAGAAATIATVSDLETPAGSLVVTVDSAPAGISITGITNSNGVITASLAASCTAAATANTVTLKVTDATGLTRTANLIVNVTANTSPTLGNYSSAGTIKVGESATVTPDAAPVDNGQITSLTAAATGFDGKFTVNPSTGAVSISDAVPAGSYTVTVTATDNCGATATRSFSLTVEKKATTVALASSKNPSEVGETVTLTATVSPADAGGSVEFRDGQTSLGVISMSGGAAAFAHTFAEVGDRQITAVYSGDASYAGSVSATLAQRVRPDEYAITTVAGNGDYGSDGNGGAATAASFKEITAITKDNDGALLIVDGLSRTVRRVDRQGVISVLAGNGANGNSGDGGPATAARFGLPAGVAVDAAGNVYIADAQFNRIRIVTPDGKIEHFAGDRNGVGNFSGDGGFATSARFRRPTRLAFEPGHNGEAGNLYVADSASHRIRRINLTTKVITTVAGFGYAGYTGDDKPAVNASLNNPAGLAIDTQGNLYIADSGNQRIRKVTVASGMITTIAGTGEAGFSGDEGEGAAATLRNPSGVAVDGAGNVYIADQGNHRLRMISATDGRIRTITGNGEAAFSGDNGPAALARISSPLDVCPGTASGRVLFLADSDNRRVRKLDKDASLNSPPVAIANSLPTDIPPDDVAGATVHLDGSASGDPDGDHLSFIWTDNGAVIATTAVADVRLGIGRHSIVLTVRDGHGGENSTAPQIVSVGVTGVTIDQIAPGSGRKGDTLQLIITGSGFTAQSKVSFSGLGVTPLITSYLAPQRLKVIVRISTATSAGARNVTVTNPDGSSATKAGAFTVR